MQSLYFSEQSMVDFGVVKCSKVFKGSYGVPYKAVTNILNLMQHQTLTILVYLGKADSR